jgi:hypothetical protein
MQVAIEAQQDCWSAAMIDPAHECTPEGKAATDTPEWNEVLAELETYRNTGRVLPVRYKVGASVKRSLAEEECQDLSTPQLTYRLPTRTEVRQLAPLIGFGNIDWDGADPHEIWFVHPNPTEQCDDPEYPHPFYRNRPEASSAYWSCAPWSTIISWRDIQAVCVPSSGPLALVDAP